MKMIQEIPSKYLKVIHSELTNKLDSIVFVNWDWEKRLMNKILKYTLDNKIKLTIFYEDNIAQTNIPVMNTTSRHTIYQIDLKVYSIFTLLTKKLICSITN